MSHSCCPWPKGMSWPWTKVISPRSKSHCTHSQNSCPDFSLLTQIWIIFHTIVGMSRLWTNVISQAQGHSAHMINTFLLFGYCLVRTVLVKLGTNVSYNNDVSLPWPKAMTLRSRCMYVKSVTLPHTFTVIGILYYSQTWNTTTCDTECCCGNGICVLQMVNAQSWYQPCARKSHHD